MPRITSRKVETTDLQGPDSFVVFRSLSYEAAKKARRFQLIGDVRARTDLSVEEIDRMLAEEEQVTLKLVSDGVLEWNWQDENGNALPLPKSAEELDRLTASEVQFIVACSAGQFPDTVANAKN